nr:MAG TPA: hypothetical protein [Caudoviricetes sp.]
MLQLALSDFYQSFPRLSGAHDGCRVFFFFVLIST